MEYREEIELVAKSSITTIYNNDYLRNNQDSEDNKAISEMIISMDANITSVNIYVRNTLNSFGGTFKIYIVPNDYEPDWFSKN